MASDDINNPLLSEMSDHGEARHAAQLRDLKAQAEGGGRAQMPYQYSQPRPEDQSKFIGSVAEAVQSATAAPKTDQDSVLVEAEKIINGQRQQEYGSPKESFGRIAAFWTAYLGHEVTPHDVAVMMILLKSSRAKNGFHRDSFVDIAGYAGLSEMLE